MYILWDKLFQTDKKIKSNRPDILMIDQELKNCLLIDMAVFALNEIHLSKWLKAIKILELGDRNLKDLGPYSRNCACRY